MFGLTPPTAVEAQPGRFDLRGALNDLPWVDRVQAAAAGESFGALGLKVKVTPAKGKVAGTFADGTPATLTNRFGKGVAVYVATCPGVSYAKDAGFVSSELRLPSFFKTRRFVPSTLATTSLVVVLPRLPVMPTTSSFGC